MTAYVHESDKPIAAGNVWSLEKRTAFARFELSEFDPKPPLGTQGLKFSE
jgi:hypothetical protein